MQVSRTENLLNKEAQIEIYKSIADRKEVGTVFLKTWEQTSRHNLHLVKVLIEEMFDKLDKILSDSSYRYEKITRFFLLMKLSFNSDFSFKDHINKFQFWETSTDKNAKNQVDLYNTSLSEYIESTEKELIDFQTSLNKFQKNVEQNIIYKILIETTKQNDAKLKDLSNQKRDLWLIIRKLSTETLECYDFLLKSLQDSINSQTRLKRPTINLFPQVFEFVNNVRKLALQLREYGQNFIDIFNTVKALEKDRLNAIRNAFFEFNKLLEKTFSVKQVQGFKYNELNLRKIKSGLWDASYFDIKSVITPSQAEFLTKNSNVSDLNIENLRELFYLEKIEENIKELFDHFIMRRFLVKEADLKSACKNDVILYLTIDYFYNIYLFDKTTKKATLIADVPIEKMNFLAKDKNIVDFNFETTGFLWNSQKKISLFFLNKDVEEFKIEHVNYLSLLQIEVTKIETPRKTSVILTNQISTKQKNETENKNEINKKNKVEENLENKPPENFNDLLSKQDNNKFEGIIENDEPQNSPKENSDKKMNCIEHLDTAEDQTEKKTQPSVYKN